MLSTATMLMPDEVQAMKYKDLQAACKARGLGGKGKADELRAKLLDSMDTATELFDEPEVEAVAEEAPVVPVVEEIEEVPELMDEQADPENTAALFDKFLDVVEKAELIEQCDAGDEPACETVTRDDEFKKDWSKRGMPAVGEMRPPRPGLGGEWWN